jgi:hypothetical protein
VLLDRVLPDFQFVERHRATIPAPAATVYRTLWEVDFARSATIRFLFAVRGLGRGLRQGRRRIHARVDDFLRAGFILLGEIPGEELVLGRVLGASTGVADAAAFAALDEPGHVRAAINFHVRPDRTGTLVTTETRVHATDQQARGRFARYWLVVGPFSALIRRRMLAVLRAEVARTA